MSNEIYSLFQSKKKENESKLILIKNGDLFETYDEDAQIVAEEIELLSGAVYARYTAFGISLFKLGHR